MTWSIDDQQTRHINIDGVKRFTFLYFLDKFLAREEGSSDLLSDTTCFSFLNICPPDFVK